MPKLFGEQPMKILIYAFLVTVVTWALLSLASVADSKVTGGKLLGFQQQTTSSNIATNPETQAKYERITAYCKTSRSAMATIIKLRMAGVIKSDAKTLVANTEKKDSLHEEAKEIYNQIIDYVYKAPADILEAASIYARSGDARKHCIAEQLKKAS